MEDRVAALVSDLERALPLAGASLLESRGHVYGVRNLVEVWPSAHTVASEIARRAAIADCWAPASDWSARSSSTSLRVGAGLSHGTGT